MPVTAGAGSRSTFSTALPLLAGLICLVTCSYGEEYPRELPFRVSSRTAYDPFGADEFADASHSPRIPEPMVFDLVRPLGARQGELEINTLAIVPLTSYRSRRPPVTDPFGITPLSVDRTGVEWAPEIEYALRDGLAFEFELPFEEGRLEAYKFAGQYTFGTAFNGQFIHGVQGIVQPTVNFSEWDLTLLYLLGVRFDETWSALAMLGGRTAVGASQFDERTETLCNLTLFADVAPQATVAVETNYARNLRGAATLLVMPQLHWEATDQFMLQLGVGAGFTVNEVIPALGLRAIYSW